MVSTLAPPTLKTADVMKSQGHIDSLSQEVLLEIFSYLDPASLLSVAQVNRRWNHLSEDSLFWQKNLATQRRHAATFCSCGVHRCLGSPNASLKTQFYKKLMTDTVIRPVAAPKSSGKLFGKQAARLPEQPVPSSVCARKNPAWGYFANHAQGAMATNASAGEAARPARVVLFGPGLDGAGSNLVYDLMWGTGSPFKTLGMFPNSHSGIGGGVKLLYQKAGIELELVTLYRATKKEREAFTAALGTRTNRIIDSEFMLTQSKVVSASADAFIYVCDKGIAPEPEIQREFEVLVGAGAPQAPVWLIMPDVIEGGSQTCSDYVDALGLASNPRRWWMSTLDLGGRGALEEGLDWLLESAPPAAAPAGTNTSFLGNLSSKFSLSSLF